MKSVSRRAVANSWLRASECDGPTLHFPRGVATIHSPPFPHDLSVARGFASNSARQSYFDVTLNWQDRTKLPLWPPTRSDVSTSFDPDDCSFLFPLPVFPKITKNIGDTAQENNSVEFAGVKPTQIQDESGPQGRFVLACELFDDSLHLGVNFFVRERTVCCKTQREGDALFRRIDSLSNILIKYADVLK